MFFYLFLEIVLYLIFYIFSLIVIPFFNIYIEVVEAFLGFI